MYLGWGVAVGKRASRHAKVHEHTIANLTLTWCQDFWRVTNLTSSWREYYAIFSLQSSHLLHNVLDPRVDARKDTRMHIPLQVCAPHPNALVGALGWPLWGRPKAWRMRGGCMRVCTGICSSDCCQISMPHKPTLSLLRVQNHQRRAMVWWLLPGHCCPVMYRKGEAIGNLLACGRTACKQLM